MAKSQNGWTASANRGDIGVVDLVVDGVKFPNGVRGGDVLYVAQYTMRRFDTEVESLHAGWCWGYAYREIEGSADLSNHASGTAWDVNAPRHPIGRRGTFTSAQRAAILRIVAACDGVIRWGGSYTGRVDEMHFEVVKSASAVATLARKLRGGSTPPPSPGTGLPKHRPGSRTLRYVKGTPIMAGSDVQFLQEWIGSRCGDADGRYGPKSVAGVRWYQDMRGLVVDGIAGPKTWAPILAAL